MASKFAIVTGASTGIGYALARRAAVVGHDLLLAADTPFIDEAAGLGPQHGSIETLDLDLATMQGVDRLLAAARGRPVDLLCANAGRGLGHAFLEQDPLQWRHVIDTNITGTLYLLQQVLRQMAARGEGRVLVTGSIAGYIPGSFQAVYNGTKAFIDNFTDALRNELKDAPGVTLTTLMPGPVETEFFERADMLDTAVAESDSKSDPLDVARDGYRAVMAGKSRIVSGLANKLQVAAANITPAPLLAARHRKMAEPGTAG